MQKQLFELIFSIKRRCVATEESIRKELNLTHSEFTGLLTLNPDEEIVGWMFSDRLGLSPSRGSRVLNQLNVHGYTNTDSDRTDRRNVRISLTPHGVKTKKSIEDRLIGCELKVKSRLSNQDIESIKSALTALDEALK